MKKYSKLFLILLIFVFVFFGVACEINLNPITPKFEKKQISSNRISLDHQVKDSVDSTILTDSTNITSYYDFINKLYPNYDKDKQNIVLSPLSAYIALSMLTNGAANSSLTELEDLLGLNVDNLNLYCKELYSYYNEVNPGIISTSDSFWLNNTREDYTVKQTFLNKIKDYYASDVYLSSFNDQTLADINNWVYNKTKGLIPNVLDQIPADAIFYLINTVLFDAKWNGSLNEIKHDFTNIDATTSKDIKMMSGTVSNYYSNEEAKGFMLNYNSDNGKYAFFGILANDYQDYVSANIGTKINDLLKSKITSHKEIECHYLLPEFEFDYKLEIKDIMESRGYTNIYSEEEADFTNMFDFTGTNIFVSRCFQKARIEVSKEGTKAAAATIIEGMKVTSVGPSETEEYYVYLDKPFIYCIYDLENNIPVFVGSIGKL